MFLPEAERFLKHIFHNFFFFLFRFTKAEWAEDWVHQMSQFNGPRLSFKASKRDKEIIAKYTNLCEKKAHAHRNYK